MAFNTIFFAKSPDADKTEHQSTIRTGKTTLHSSIVRNLEDCLFVYKMIAEKEKVDAITLCPGFTHSEVAEIVKQTGGTISVTVARGDSLSGRIVQEAFKREGLI